MTYDDWKATPPAEAASTPTQGEREPEADVCRDCGDRYWGGAKSTPYGVSCDPCWRVRERLGGGFDARALPQIQAAARKGAA